MAAQCILMVGYYGIIQCSYLTTTISCVVDVNFCLLFWKIQFYVKTSLFCGRLIKKREQLVQLRGALLHELLARSLLCMKLPLFSSLHHITANYIIKNEQSIAILNINLLLKTGKNHGLTEVINEQQILLNMRKQDYGMLIHRSLLYSKFKSLVWTCHEKLSTSWNNIFHEWKILKNNYVIKLFLYYVQYISV